jgi:hypothetical protein
MSQRKPTDARDIQIEQPAEIVLPATGSIAGIDTSIDVVQDTKLTRKKTEAEVFNEEKLTVMIHEAADQNPENFVFISVNGRGPGTRGEKWVQRGVPVVMARKFVEVLCRAKPVNIRTKEARDFDGAQTMRVQRTAALRYPFSVISDPNPAGAQWLRNVMAQA